MEKFILLTECKDLPKGKIVFGEEYEKDLVKIQEGKTNYYIKKNKLINLTESLSDKDVERIKGIVRDILIRFFYRAYTKSSFLLK